MNKLPDVVKKVHKKILLVFIGIIFSINVFADGSSEFDGVDCSQIEGFWNRLPCVSYQINQKNKEQRSAFPIEHQVIKGRPYKEWVPYGGEIKFPEPLPTINCTSTNFGGVIQATCH